MKKSSLEKLGGTNFKFDNPDGTQDIIFYDSDQTVARFNGQTSMAGGHCVYFNPYVIHSMTYMDGSKSFMFGKVSADGKSITLDNGHVYQFYVPEK